METLLKQRQTAKILLHYLAILLVGGFK
jgi:hypothetical protein